MDPTATFADLVQRDVVPLDAAALAMAAHAWPDLDMATELARLDGMAARLMVPTRAELNRVLFGEFGLRGNADDYYVPDNSFINRVIDTTFGIPISLGVLMIEVGRRAGLQITGINAPGHFVVRDESDGAVLDPFAAGAVTRSEGPAAAPVDILARMLNNLRSIYTTIGDIAGLIWVLRLRTLLPGAGPAADYELTRAQARLN